MRCTHAPVVAITLAIAVACGPIPDRSPDRPMDPVPLDTIVVSSPAGAGTAVVPSASGCADWHGTGPSIAPYGRGGVAAHRLRSGFRCEA
jgi:hypothetical protein